MGAILAGAALVPVGTASAGSPGVDRVVDRIERQTGGCVPPAPPAETRFADAGPSDALRDQLAILRRAGTSEDAAVADRIAGLPLGEVLKGSMRVAHGPDGRAYDVVVVREPGRVVPARCRAAQRRALRRLTRGRGVRLRTAAKAELVERRRDDARVRESLRLFYRYDGGAYGGGGGSTADDLRSGQVGLSATGGGPSGAPTVLAAVVPDGVASVTWTFAGDLAVTAAVQDNVAVAETEATPIALRLERTVLRDASGAVIADVEAGRR